MSEAREREPARRPQADVVEGPTGLELGPDGESIGLTPDWAYRIVKHVGNYGESFERNVGMGSKLQLKRGLNDLASKGGLQYPHPIR